MKTLKNRLVYAMIALVVLICGCFFYGLNYQAAVQATEQDLRHNMATSQRQIQQSFADQAQVLRSALQTATAETTTTAQLLSLLAQWEQQTPGSHYYLAGQTGYVTTADGRWQTAALNQGELAQIKQDTYAVFGLAGDAADGPQIALAIPYLRNPQVFILRTEALESFAAQLAQQLAFPTNYLALFNESGAYLADYRPDSQTELYASSQAVSYGLTDYRDSGGTLDVQYAGPDGQYQVYFPLEQPAGWVVSARISPGYITPLFNSIFRPAFWGLIAWFLLLGIVVLFAILNTREQNRKNQLLTGQDPLTKLNNNAGLESAYNNFFQTSPAKLYSLCCLDITAFRRFNTMFGYPAGDTLLQTIGQVLAENYICPARISGDLFVFLLPANRQQPAEIENRLHHAIEEMMGRQYSSTVSFKFGICPIQQDQHNFREVLDSAMLALREAKQTPEQCAVVYDAELQKNTDKQLQMEANMLPALAKEEFLVYIQPKFDIHSGTCCGGEALVRWQSEQLGFLLPDDFVPLFECNGFIVEIDFYILEHVMNYLQQALEEGREVLPISVNHSRITLTACHYFSRLEQLIRRYPLTPPYIQIEITESVLNGKVDPICNTLATMKKLGLSIAMDDFGSGFSSLNTLRELPVDVLKIDKEFLRESTTSDRSRAIIRNIINMSKELNIHIVCEGVETASQLNFLQEAGCDIAQGYYFAKPLPYPTYQQAFMRLDSKQKPHSQLKNRAKGA